MWHCPRYNDLAPPLSSAQNQASPTCVPLPSHAQADIFFFSDGTLACWGASAEEQKTALDSIARPSISKPLIPGTSLPGTGEIEQVPSNLAQTVRVRFASPSWFEIGEETSSAGGTSSGGDDDNRSNATTPAAPSATGFSFAAAATAAAAAARPCALASLSGRTLTLATPRAADGRPALRTDDARRAVSSALGRSLQLTCHEQRASLIAIETDVLPEELASKGEVALESKDIAKLLGQTFLLKRCAQLLASSAAASAAELAAALSEQKYNQDIVLQDLENSSDEDSGGGSWGAKSAAARTEAGSSGSNLSLPSPSPMLQLQSEVELVCGMSGRVAALQGSLDELQELLEEVRDLESNAHGSRLEWIVIVLVAVETVVGLAEFVELLSGGIKI
ncbi:MAG: hypothetical protein WDW36_006572 [Sanguina aurantia]